MATTYISRTIGTATLATKGTFSFWVKLTSNSEMYVVGGTQNSTNKAGIGFSNTTAGTLTIVQEDAGTETTVLRTTRLFRDYSAFYHIVVAFDTPQVTASDRVKLYVNGVQETLFATATYPSQSSTIEYLESGQEMVVGTKYGSSYGNYFNGLMSHVQFVDGLALAPTEFGEVDSTSGIWKIKTGSYGTPGNNGFHLKMEDSSNMDLDSSSNGLTFTTTGTLTATKDNPSDNFNTLSPLNIQVASGTLSNGNTQMSFNADATWRNTYSSLNNSTGKYYFEMQVGNTNDTLVGVVGTLDWTNDTGTSAVSSTKATGYFMKQDGNLFNNNVSKSGGVSYTTGDVIGVALDLTNGAIWFSKDNVWVNSATISEIAAGTTTNAAYTGITTGVAYAYGACSEGKESSLQKFNFGNGYFASTAISSAGTNTSDIGLFEYDVPNGFTAWSTKGFQE